MTLTKNRDLLTRLGAVNADGKISTQPGRIADVPGRGIEVDLGNDWAKRHMYAAVPGSHWEPAPTKQWQVVVRTPHLAAIVLKLFPELTFTYPELADLRDQLAQDVRPFDNSTPAALRISDHTPVVNAALAAEGKGYYEFQNVDSGYVKAVLEVHGGAYIGHERGCGKSLQACALIEALDCQRTLIVAPNTAKDSVWRAELERFLPGHRVVVLPNQKAKRVAALSAVTTWGDAPLVLVVNYEQLAIVAGKVTHDKDGRKLRTAKLGKGWDKLGQWDMVVVDEAHRLANPRAQFVRALKKIPTTYKLALSGSIIANHAEELFSPLQWLFPEVYKAKWRDWNDRFVDYVDGWGGRKLAVGIKPDQIEKMRRELGVFMVFRRKADELPGLPDKVAETRMVDLKPAQRKAYDELLANYYTVLEDKTVIKADDALVQLTRLRQIATGLDTLGKTVADSSKLDLAVEMILDNPDEAYVVFSWYKAPCYALAERLEAKGIGTFTVTGDVKHKDRAIMIEDFQAGKGRVFIGSLSTLGESVTLHRANNVIRLDRAWNPQLNVQAEDRTHRIGQAKTVVVTDIVARATVDELRVLPALANKEAIRRALFGGTQ